jgi:predicted Zn-dependent protease
MQFNKHLLLTACLLAPVAVAQTHKANQTTTASNTAPDLKDITTNAPAVDLVATNVRILYAAENYSAMISVLQDALTRSPENSKFRLLLALAAIKLNNRSLASSQLTILSASTDELSTAYSKQLTDDLAAFDKQQRQRQAFIGACQRL